MTPGATSAAPANPGDPLLLRKPTKKPPGRGGGKDMAGGKTEAAEFGAHLAGPVAPARRAAPARPAQGAAPAPDAGMPLVVSAVVPVVGPVVGPVPLVPERASATPAMPAGAGVPLHLVGLEMGGPGGERPGPAGAAGAAAGGPGLRQPGVTIAERRADPAAIGRGGRSGEDGTGPGSGNAGAVLPPASGNMAAAGALAAVSARSSGTAVRGSGRGSGGQAGAMAVAAGAAGTGDSGRTPVAGRGTAGSMAQRAAAVPDAGPANTVNVPISFRNTLSGSSGGAGDSQAGIGAGPDGPSGVEEGQPASGSFADIAIGVDADAGLAVRLAAADEGAAERLRDEIAVLERALAAIGSDVEAIDIALRGSAGEDARRRDEEASPSAGAGDRRDGTGGADREGSGGNAGGSSSGAAWTGPMAAGAGIRGDGAPNGGTSAVQRVAGSGRGGADGKVDLYG